MAGKTEAYDVELNEDDSDEQFPNDEANAYLLEEETNPRIGQTLFRISGWLSILPSGFTTITIKIEIMTLWQSLPQRKSQ